MRLSTSSSSHTIFGVGKDVGITDTDKWIQDGQRTGLLYDGTHLYVKG